MKRTKTGSETQTREEDVYKIKQEIINLHDLHEHLTT